MINWAVELKDRVRAEKLEMVRSLMSKKSYAKEIMKVTNCTLADLEKVRK